LTFAGIELLSAIRAAGALAKFFSLLPSCQYSKHYQYKVIVGQNKDRVQDNS
jgi:hypothetical protein